MATAVIQLPTSPSLNSGISNPDLKCECNPTEREISRVSSADANRLPTQDELFASTLIPVFDAQSQSIPFQNLHPAKGRHLIVWVRQFFCGLCQDYLKALVATIPPSSLQSLATPTSITVIGCGSPDLIPDYLSFSGNCPYPIYADHDRKTYQMFGMENSLSLGPSSPDYQTSSLAHIIIKGIWQGITSGSMAVKGGKSSQLGGEMLFEDGKVIWCHRMKNTRDHTPPEIIKTLLGL